MSANVPRVGTGVIIENTDGKILVGKRIGSHAPKYSIPGGKLKLGETFEHAIKREVKEETSLALENLKVICVTNDLETYQQDGVHYISVILFTRTFKGEPKIMEPDKCEEWLWCDPKDLPKPHYDASRFGVACYLSGAVYSGASGV
jgi:mutator protein MutT